MLRIKGIVVLLCLLLCQVGLAEGGQTKDGQQGKYIGIISAMQNEIELLLSEAKIDRVDTVGGVDYHVGELCGHPVVISKAGIGKALSAAGTAAMLNRYDVSRILFTGIAGGVGDETRVLDVVIATQLVQHDYGRITNDGFEWTVSLDEKKGYYPCDEALVELAYAAAVDIVGSEHAFRGVIASGDQFVASETYVEKLKRDFNAIACEMEGASIALVCGKYEVPFVVIRTMSDKADGLAHETFNNMADVAAQHSNRIVMEMLNRMEAG